MRINDVIKQLNKCRDEAMGVKFRGDVEVFFLTPAGTLCSVTKVEFSEGGPQGPRIIISEEE